MSAKISGQIWDLDLPNNKQLVLLAMADHADHQGGNVFPSVGMIAWKTGYCERQVQRIQAELVADGLLVIVEKKRGQTIRYRINPEAGKRKADYTPSKTADYRKSSRRKKGADDYAQGGDKMSPPAEEIRQNVTPDPRHPDVTSTPDIQMSPESSVEPKDKEGGETVPASNIVEFPQPPVVEAPAKPKAEPVSGNVLRRAFDDATPANRRTPARPGDWATVKALVDMNATTDEIKALVVEKWTEPTRYEYRFSWLVADLVTWRAKREVGEAAKKPRGVWTQTTAPKSNDPVVSPEERKAMVAKAKQMRAEALRQFDKKASGE